MESRSATRARIDDMEGWVVMAGVSRQKRLLTLALSTWGGADMGRLTETKMGMFPNRGGAGVGDVSFFMYGETHEFELLAEEFHKLVKARVAELREIPATRLPLAFDRVELCGCSRRLQLSARTGVVPKRHAHGGGAGPDVRARRSADQPERILGRSLVQKASS